MQRALKRFKKTLKTLDAAEVGLRSALRTMLACGTGMTQLKEEIAHATTKALGGMWKSSGTDDCPRPRRGFWPRYLAATLSPVVERACARSRPFCWLLYSYIYTHTQLQARLDKIRKHNERAGCGTRRAVLNTVLVQLADIDMNLRIGPAERRKLLRLLSNMTGLKAAELCGFYAALELVVDPEASVASGGLKCDSPRTFKTQEVLDKLDELGAFELLLGLDAPSSSELDARRGGAHAPFEPLGDAEVDAEIDDEMSTDDDSLGMGS